MFPCRRARRVRTATRATAWRPATLRAAARQAWPPRWTTATPVLPILVTLSWGLSIRLRLLGRPVLTGMPAPRRILARAASVLDRTRSPALPLMLATAWGPVIQRPGPARSPSWPMERPAPMATPAPRAIAAWGAPVRLLARLLVPLLMRVTGPEPATRRPVSARSRCWRGLRVRTVILARLATPARRQAPARGPRSLV